MSEYIVEVHSISAANGWVFEDNRSAVACFVLVSTCDTQFPTNGCSKLVIAIDERQLGSNLVGEEIISRMQSVRREDT